MNKLLNKEQLSEQIGVSTATIAWWIHTNKIPYIKLPNNGVRFDEKKIENWLKARSNSTNVAGIKI